MARYVGGYDPSGGFDPRFDPNLIPAGFTVTHDRNLGTGDSWTVSDQYGNHYTFTDLEVQKYRGDMNKLIADLFAVPSNTITNNSWITRNSWNSAQASSTSFTAAMYSAHYPDPPTRKKSAPVRNMVWGLTAPEPPEPFYSTDPVLGFRSISYFGGQFQGQHSGSWNTGMHIAHCQATRSHFSADHPGPGWECNCGIYAHKLSHVEGCGWGNNYLLTLVGMEHVIEHEEGYRAGRAWVIAVARTRDPFDQKYAEEEQKRMKLLIDHTWPLEVPFCATPDKLYRVYDFMSKNPNKIPKPTDEAWRYCAQEERNR